MTDSYETRITRAIVGAYHDKLSRSLVSDVLIAGAGPSGLRAAMDLAAKGRTVTVLEKGPNREIAEALEGTGIELHAVGDANAPRGVLEAVQEAYDVAVHL
ncbi:MAG: FAD-binding protein [Gemmatimonadota bacterium]